MTLKEFKIQYALGSLSRYMLLEIAEDNQTPKGILAILSSDKRMFIRIRVVRNFNTPKKILNQLLKDISWIVRLNARENPSRRV